MTTNEALSLIISSTVTGLLGWIAPNHKPMSIVKTVSGIIVETVTGVMKSSNKSVQVKGDTTMNLPNIGGLFAGAFKWIEENPHFEETMVDVAKDGLAILAGDVVALEANLKKTILDSAIPEPWKSILAEDLVVNAVAQLVISKGKAVQADSLAAKQASSVVPQPAEVQAA